MKFRNEKELEVKWNSLGEFVICEELVELLDLINRENGDMKEIKAYYNDLEDLEETLEKCFVNDMIIEYHKDIKKVEFTEFGKYLNYQYNIHMSDEQYIDYIQNLSSIDSGYIEYCDNHTYIDYYEN